MAIRFREGRKAPWIVYWKNPFTGKTEEEVFSSEQDAKKANSLVKHRLKFERESFRPEDHIEQDAVGDSLHACYYLYLKSKQFPIKRLRWSTYCMKHALEQIGSLPVSAIGRAELEKVLHAAKSSGVKPVTVRAHMAVLRTVLRWCVQTGIIDSMPPYPSLPPAHYEHFIPPSPSEAESLCRVAPPHLVRVILLGSKLGVRVGPSELLQMKWSDVDLLRGVVRVRAAKKRLSQPWREVPIQSGLLTLMREWATEDAAIGVDHVINFNGKPVQSIKRSWSTALRNAGIHRRLRPYDLRHAFATDAIAADVDVGTVAQIMGNDPKTLLDHYQHVADTRKRSAVEALPEMSIYGKKLRQENSEEIL